MPPTNTNQPEQPASPPPVSSQPPAPAPVSTPSSPPTAAGGATQTPPPAPVSAAPAPVAPPQPTHSKRGFFIAVPVIILLLLGTGLYMLYGRGKSQPTQTTPVAESSTSMAQADSGIDCAVTLHKYPTNPDKGYVMSENWPVGFNMHDTGDDDSRREYCQGAKLKARAEEFISALSSHDWAKAHSYLTKAEAAASPLASRSAQWKAEYGAYTFSPSNYPLYSPTDELDYAVETCRDDFSAGWSKEIQSGYYQTPFMMLDKEKSVSTKIALAMSLEDDVWKVVGDNNALHNTTGIIGGDAYSNAQADRDFSSFWSCE